MLSMVQSAPDIFYFNSNKMGYWLVQKALQSKCKYAINTYFVLRLREVSPQQYAHLFTAAAATTVVMSVYITYSSVRAWMDGSQTAVEGQETERGTGVWGADVQM